ncbi:AAA domain-containing protein [Filimonas lacunae]|uniref:AAA domain-containing protein n=1 Tax=Filimonas lacunae TaxID=477680 RepID=A0A173MEV9_9BACT|nr:DUF3320 domain-containing protein [Filimonas lacunae]BAV05968.1 DNA helicase related protein [Filimonas lacunae]SIT23973.1 AAA domain-containing protein [Filimonas lacunae]
MKDHLSNLIHARLESSRKELLDLGLRNPLLNYKASKARGLQMVQEKSAAVFDILVKQGKGMTFTGRSGKDESSEVAELPALSEEAQQEAFYDTRLQTNEVEGKLQTKLLNTYYAARTSIEEQGVNILYMALGMLNWYEEGNGENVRKAPIVLIPVALDRSSAQERFKLRYTSSEIGANLSLQAKMLADFHITIPDIQELEDFAIEAYFEEIEQRIKRNPGWSVERDNIQLGFFSFGKFMLYHDLDIEKWPEAEKPYDHTIIQAIFHEGFTDAPPTTTEADNLDEDARADALLYVIDSDSSQALAMLAVDEGRNLVIQGPPGTGKSQTITNIIANALGKGKKVLFVAEKMAALDVVKRRLDNIQLGVACLELHSHKANKKELHEELRRVLDLGRPTLAHLEKEISLLAGYKEELNDYSKAVNKTIAQSGLSPHQIIGLLLQANQRLAGVALPVIPIPDIAAWDAYKMHYAEAAADKIRAKVKDTGTPARMLFQGSGLRVLLKHEEEKMPPVLHHVITVITELQHRAAALSQHLNLQAPLQKQAVYTLLDIAQLALRNPGLQGVDITSPLWLQQADAIEELLEQGKIYAQIQAEYKTVLLPEAWDLPVLEIRQNLVAYGNVWYRFLIGRYKQSVRQLASVTAVGLPKEVAGKLAYVDAILGAKRAETVINANEELGAALFGIRWQKNRSNWEVLQTVFRYVKEVHQQIAAGKCPASLLEYLAKATDTKELEAFTAALTGAFATYEPAINQALQQLGFTHDYTIEGVPFGNAYFTAQQEKLHAWANNLPEIHKAIGWNNLVDAVHKEGFDGLVQTATHWDHAQEYLTVLLQKIWYEHLIQQAFESLGALRKFERATHEEIVQKFQQLDVLSLQYNRARVALKHWENVPRAEAGGQVNVLKTEFNKRARHMPVRRLMQEAGMAIQAIKPVFMMSPMSIANFLAPGSLEFDLVIFDEASQVRPVEALGAIIRGKQLVVVGDSRQLPPTSFFDTMNKEVDEEENMTADVQSILGMCDGQGAPHLMLRWHYRSRHESLISLSNHEFYENKLVIFPSPGSQHQMGLVFHHLPDAVYDRGKSRTNQQEAETVAAAVIAHAQKHPKQTLGVVAFSTSQMQAIQLALEIQRRKHPETEAFFKNHSHEPFFVKNLENVQGDERDVIFISIGYGKTEEGKVPMNFGPLNNEGGERRLNVLITRAKQRCEVFTNITAADVNSDRPGIKALKNFLFFAQYGKLDMGDERRKTEAAPFEDVVAAGLEAAGYTVRKQVGSAGFYLDMAVVDAEHPGRYVLGIQCDGATYAAAKSARDRDRLREQVLKGMGWQICQVWSTDWYRNPDRELQRLIAIIEAAKVQLSLDDSIEEEMQESKGGLIREEVVMQEVLQPSYQFAVLSAAEISGQEMHLHPVSKLSGWVEEVVKVESPVHFEEAAKRVLTAAGVGKLGGRIRESLQQAIQHAVQNGRIIVKEDFLWHHTMDTPIVRERSHLPATSKKIQYVAPEEISLAIKQVVESSIAISPDAAVPFVARMLGFSRTTEETRKEILKVIDISVDKRIIQKEGEVLTAQTGR